MDENGITETLFDHSNRSISVATMDHNCPTLYCYVSNQNGRKLYLFECPDVLSTKKVMDATYAAFKRQTTPSRPPKENHCSSLPTMNTRRPPPPPLPHSDEDDNTYLITR